MAKQKLKVALNPRNPEAASWYDPITGVNLFLGEVRDRNDRVTGGPISNDLSGFTNSELNNIVKGINKGLLIVVEGEIPDGVDVKSIPSLGSPRSRWSRPLDEDDKEHKDFSQEEAVAQATWEKLIAKKLAESKTAEKAS